MNKKIILKIWTMILATVMVASLSVVSVSAVPAEYTVAEGGYEFTDFDDGVLPTSKFASDGNRTRELSTEKAHSGQYSMKINGYGYTDKDSFSKFWYTTGLTLEANTTYYVSFWYYSDNNTFNTTLVSKPSGATMSAVGNSGTAIGQWNKVWYTFTTGATVSSKLFSLGIWGMGSGKCGYIDDFEIAKLESAAVFENKVPDVLDVAASAICNLESSISVQSCFDLYDRSKATTSVTAEVANHGEASLKYTSTVNTGFYININNTFGADVAIETGKAYYLSFYVYSPDTDVSLNVITIKSVKITDEISIPAGEWTKVSALFTIDEATGSDDNKHLLKMSVNDNGKNAVYFDDFVFAKLANAPAEVSLTANKVDYDFESHTADVTFVSPVEIKSSIDDIVIASPNGGTVTSQTISSDKKTVTVSLSGIEENTTYPISFIGVVDMFDRESTVNTSFATPSSMVISDVTETVDSDNVTYKKTIKKNSNGTMNVAMIVATYDAKGVMISVGMDINNVAGGASSSVVPFEVTVKKGETSEIVLMNWATFTPID